MRCNRDCFNCTFKDCILPLSDISKQEIVDSKKRDQEFALLNASERQKYYLNNKEKIAIYNKEYYQVNREKQAEYLRNYYQKNKKRIQAYKKKWYKAKKNS